ncbi:oxidoreductase family protein [Punctularia strigosozonata HHB-11173 SS5]|uniref:oxidoreductase family protein n=1 Tax=Punctularia strigosozonata (strain HHB-11173) TaxID=741275 RepID=UPI0004416AEC|nr:oxidoreductase family protein [Punctularia strigosozonata HHB-11173 SS5]EIN14628.1 oxidoreductase family protein [Punctularia strigosozonata HHB-11173 SS5]
MSGTGNTVPTGIAILGAGIFAKEAHLPALASLGGSITLKATYSRSERSASDLAVAAQKTLGLTATPDVYYDSSSDHNLDALLARSDISAVIVVLPITTQPSIILKALAAGKHVLSEKPVAPDVASGLKLIAEYETKYKAKGLVWRVAENYEAEPGQRVAAEAIKTGKIGSITYFSARFVNYVDENSKWYQTPWRTVPDYQGGFLLDGGVHFAAVLRELFPTPLKGLSGFASLNKKILAPHDTITATLNFEGGPHGLLEISFAAPHLDCGLGNGYTIIGSDGWLTLSWGPYLKDDEGKPVSAIQVTINKTVKTKKENGDVETKVETEVIHERTRGVQVEIASFLHAVEGQDDGLGLGEARNALKDVAVIEAALNSGGKYIDLQALVQERS